MTPEQKQHEREQMLRSLPDLEMLNVLSLGLDPLTQAICRDLAARLRRVHAAIDEVADDVGAYVWGTPPHPIRAALEKQNRLG